MVNKIIKNNIKSEIGITLIALVITIIVLLILAGISISMLSGDNSILSRAGQARDKTEESSREEQRRLTMLEAALNVNGEDYNGVKIPAGFAPTKKEGESTVDEGLVITDSQGNEYVWIEVPNDGTGPVYTEVASAEENSDDYYRAIATALRTYCTKDASGGDLIKDGTTSDGTYGKTSTYGYTDVWYDGTGKLEGESSNKEDKNGCGLTCNEYKELYKKMLKSVYTNGGFWIGRYEAGTTSPRGNKNDPTEDLKAESKQDLYPINYVKCFQAQTIASKASSSASVNSSLMFGIQWDLVLRFLSNKGIETSLLNDNSSTWGNYSNQPFEINRGKYSVASPWNVYIDYTQATENKVTVEGNVSRKIGTTATDKILLTTGASDTNSKKNIYDLAGNMWEWTLEHATEIPTQPTQCAIRGGSFGKSGDSRPVSYRNHDTTSSSDYYLGFRVALY